MRLEFSAEKHEYYLDGRRVPSVTGIQRISGLVSAYSFDDPLHSFRGHAVHSGCALLDQGGDPWFGVEGMDQRNPRYSEYVQVAHDINHGYLPAYRKFRERTGFQGFTYELGMIHPTLQFGGTLDVCGECGDEIWLVDLKSGILPDLVPVQLAAYHMLIREGLPIDPEHPGLGWLKEVVKSGRKILRKAVRLEKDGTDTLFSFTSKRDHYDSRMFDVSWAGAISNYNLRAKYGFL